MNGISSISIYEDKEWRTEAMMVANKRKRVHLFSSLLSYLGQENDDTADSTDYDFPRGAVGKGYVLVRIPRHSASPQSKSQAQEPRDDATTF